MTCEVSILGGVQLGLTLDRYQELMRLAPAAFNGLDNPAEANCYDCWAIWKQTDRDAMAIVIAQAEEMRERELSYHVSPKWETDDQAYSSSSMYFLRMKHLIKIGTYATSDISLCESVTYRDAFGAIIDPVIISVATTVTDPDEICIFHPGTSIRINPTKISITAGVAEICIPRPRLRYLTVDTNCEPYPLYIDDANFERCVDIKRCYIDETDGADIICKEHCECTTTTVSDTCSFIRDARLAVIMMYPNECLATCCHPSKVSIPYLSGIESSIYTEMMTAALANSLLRDIIPAMVDLCNCWKSDMTVEDNALYNPYGIANGAVKAWLADSRAKVGQGGKFPNPRR
jgi:hypothetical protein